MAIDPVTAAGLITAGGSFLTNIFSAREARENRRFQERMSSTAHTREVNDLRRAGLNPMMSMRGGGASTPSGSTPQFENPAAGYTSAANARRLLEAQIKLLNAQEQNVHSETIARNAALDESIAGRGSRVAMLANEAQLKEMSVSQRREMFQLEIEKIKSEIGMLVSSAKATDARRALDELSREGAMNEAEFEKRIGTGSPALRRLIDMMRLYNLATGDPIRRIP